MKSYSIIKDAENKEELLLVNNSLISNERSTIGMIYRG